MSDRTPARLLLLDSCAIVNLYASAQFESIIDCLEGDICIVDYVRRESQCVRNNLKNDVDEKEPIQLDGSIDAGYLNVLELQAESEFALFLSLALRLDEGEAATLALAVARHGIVVTDDRKAISIAGEVSVPVLTTPDVLHCWVEMCGLPESTVGEALRNIRLRARFESWKSHPLHGWWQATLASGELT